MKLLSKASPEKRTVASLVIVAALVLLLGVWLWYQFVYSSAERVFWGMIDSSLQTNGVTRTIEQSEESSSTKQLLQLELGASNAAKSLTIIEQKNPEGETTRVVTESLGTSDANYSRYREITTPQQVNFGATLDTWGKEDANAQSQTQSVLSEAVFGVVPFAKLNPAQRAEVMKFIHDKNVYKVDFATAEKASVDGTESYVYKVEIDTVSYIEMLKLVDKLMGLKQLELIDPSSYASTPVIPLELSVAVDSRQLLRARYDSVDREERFSGYGIQPGFEIPQTTVSRQDLESQLQSVLQEAN